MAQRRILARNREMRSPTQTGSGSRGSQSQGALNLERKQDIILSGEFTII